MVTGGGASAPDGVGAVESNQRYRHPSDVARLVFSALLIALLLLAHALAGDDIRSFSRELLLLVDGLPDALGDGLVGLVQFGAAVMPLVVVVVLVRRRQFLRLLVLAGAAVAAAAVMALLSGVVESSVPLEDLGFDGVNSWFIGSQYPSATYLAAITAVLVASSPWLRRSWRVAGWVFVLSLVVARSLSATEVPVRNGLLLAIGAFAGSLALVVVGAPRRQIDTLAVGVTLNEVGVAVDDVRPAASGRHDDPVFVGMLDGEERCLVKVLGRDQRDADLLFGAWRTLTVKGLGDSGTIRSPSRAVEHEALALSLFRAAGVRAPAPLAVARTPHETAVLAVEPVPGVPLARLTSGEVSDEALGDLWRQIGRLQRRHLAHRQLDARNIVVDGHRVAVVDGRRADLQATEEILGADVAEALVTLALTVGPDRAVASAAEHLSAEQLARGVPLIQRSVCSRETRAALGELDDDGEAFLTHLRDSAAERAGIDKVEVTPIQRITVQGAVSLVGSAVLVWYVISLASDWDLIWDAFSQSELIYVIPIVALSMATYLTGAMSLLGAVPIDLRFGRTTAVMFGQSFLNRFTPANAGGMAMRVRYLQLEGLDGAVAATSIGLTSAASGIAQGLMIVVFLFWGGASDRFSDFEFPDIGAIVLGILVVGLVASVVLMSTWGRQTLRPWLAGVIDKVRDMLRDIASDPRKMAQLLGGAVLGKLANITAFWLSAVAFGVDISFPKAGALYIIANTIGSAVPTPGGVGGVDAALTAALISFGVGNADAAAIVLMFRMLTFWLPTVPGYGFLRYTQRAGIV